MLSDQARLFVKVFTEIDRMPQLLAYYYKCHKVLGSSQLVKRTSHLYSAPTFGLEERERWAPFLKVPLAGDNCDAFESHGLA